jgi:hypothetical protein
LPYGIEGNRFEWQFRDKALTINSYQFERQTTNNTWELMPTIDVKDGTPIGMVGTNWGTNGLGIVLGPVKEGDAVDCRLGTETFPEAFNGKITVPGGTIAGTFLLEGPKHGIGGSIRCRIKDSTDHEFVALVSQDHATNLQTILPWQSGILGVPLGEDAKNIPIIPWSKTGF